MSGNSRVDLRPFASNDLAPAAVLLAGRHRRHREAEALLDPTFEDPAATQREIEALLNAASADAWTSLRGGALVGYLIGFARDATIWGQNVWVETAGHAATDSAVVGALYTAAAAAWVGEGRTNHHVLVPATDVALVDAWFGLDFGQQHVEAIREVPDRSFGVVARSELVIRPAERSDVPVLAELEVVLPRHLARSPVFSRLPETPTDEILADLEAEFDDPTLQCFVAEVDGRVVGSSLGCPIEKSSRIAALNRPPRAAYLAHAVVLPDARGLGVGRALGEAVLAWARDAGYASIVTDWRSTNLEADRTWRALGFRPTFRRLHRSII